MEVYRVCTIRNAQLTGDGAKLMGGRWNSKGIAVIYCSENRSLAALEFIVHFTDSIIPDDLMLMSIFIPHDSVIAEIKQSKLPKNWKTYPAPAKLAGLGDAWIENNKSLLLRVPSVLVDNECNYLINPAHKDMNKVKVIKKEKFGVDERLVRN